MTRFVSIDRDPLRRLHAPEHRPRRRRRRGQREVPGAVRVLPWPESGKGDGPTGKALAAAGQPAPRDFTVGDFKLDTDKDGTRPERTPT